LDDPIEELASWRERLIRFVEEFDGTREIKELNEAWKRAHEMGKSSSRSSLGYQANVYYEGFREPPPGEHFNVEWGLSGGNYFGVVNENWRECSPSELMTDLYGTNGEDALRKAQAKAEEGLKLWERAKEEMLSILTLYLASHDDSFLKRIAEEVEKSKVLDAGDIANEMIPKRQIMTRDERAVSQGTWAPPHVKVIAQVDAVHQPAAHAKKLVETLEKVEAHLARARKREVTNARVGTNVFICHGRSAVWRDLKDFVKDRLRLPYDEFNRVPVAGITNITRLSEMLDSAACAFVIMTAEDEAADGKMHARMNVIHEVGLFQGRIGFTKAIVLLEEGCEEFSNIQGLGQIRFPKGNISAKFEDIRQVLEREGLLPATSP
jgi:predicted nucleotide-binding protein